MAHLDKLKEWLVTLDEVLLCELLDISAQEIVERFTDRLLERRSYIEQELEILDSSITDEELNFEDDPYERE